MHVPFKAVTNLYYWCTPFEVLCPMWLETENLTHICWASVAENLHLSTRFPVMISRLPREAWLILLLTYSQQPPSRSQSTLTAFLHGHGWMAMAGRVIPNALKVQHSSACLVGVHSHIDFTRDLHQPAAFT